MPLQVETIIATRLASDLAEAMDDLDIVPPVEAADGLRQTLLQRCMFYRKLLKAHYDGRLIDRLKREQMFLVLNRQSRQHPHDSPLFH